jgi:hypothetical protein
MNADQQAQEKEGEYRREDEKTDAAPAWRGGYEEVAPGQGAREKGTNDQQSPGHVPRDSSLVRDRLRKGEKRCDRRGPDGEAQSKVIHLSGES